MNNKIEIKCERVAMSASGNVEWFAFEIKSERSLSDELVKKLAFAHEGGGQSYSCEYEMQDGLHIYKGESKSYSD